MLAMYKQWNDHPSLTATVMQIWCWTSLNITEPQNPVNPLANIFTLQVFSVYHPRALFCSINNAHVTTAQGYYMENSNQSLTATKSKQWLSPQSCTGHTGLGTALVNEMNFGMDHATGAGLSTPPVNLQSSALPLCNGCTPVTTINTAGLRKLVPIQNSTVITGQNI